MKVVSFYKSHNTEAFVTGQLARKHACMHGRIAEYKAQNERNDCCWVQVPPTFNYNPKQPVYFDFNQPVCQSSAILSRALAAVEAMKPGWPNSASHRVRKKCHLFHPKRMKYNAKILIVPGLLDRLNEEQKDNIISFVSFRGDFTSQCQTRKNVKSLCLL